MAGNPVPWMNFWRALCPTLPLSPLSQQQLTSFWGGPHGVRGRNRTQLDILLSKLQRGIHGVAGRTINCWISHSRKKLQRGHMGLQVKLRVARFPISCTDFQRGLCPPPHCAVYLMNLLEELHGYRWK